MTLTSTGSPGQRRRAAAMMTSSTTAAGLELGEVSALPATRAIPETFLATLGRPKNVATVARVVFRSVNRFFDSATIS